MFEPVEFKLLGKISSSEVQDIMDEINSDAALWTDYASFKLASDLRKTLILKRFPAAPVKIDAQGNKSYYAPAEWEDQCIETVNYKNLSKIRGLILQIMNDNGWTKLGIALVSHLLPGGEVPAHSDEGEYFDKFHRVHVQLAGGPHNLFTINGITKVLEPGEIWLIDDRKVHSVVNGLGTDDDKGSPRVNLYFDAI